MRWVKNSVVLLVCAIGWLIMNPQPVHGQLVGIWLWRNLVAPELGGPWIAPDVRFRPLGLLDDDRYWGPNGPNVSNNQALIVVNVPDENARVWIEGQPMKETGRQRVFITPPLEAGFSYTYEIRGQWGGTDQTRTVPIRLGQHVIVDFGREPRPTHMPLAD